MRQLDPKVAETRKRKVLEWAVQYHIKSSRPLASSVIAEESGLDLSSATIRGILKELEDEGYLHQPHTSSGRVPTDRGYRFYVDYLEDIRRLASSEKASIESQYAKRMSEMDNLLSQTSKLLSHISHKTGLVLSPRIESQTLRRIELIPLGGGQLLAIIVTSAGQVRHWPIKLSFTPSSRRVQLLNRFLNEHVQGKSIGEIRSTLAARIEQAAAELRDVLDIAKELLGEIGDFAPPDALYLNGAVSLMEAAPEFGNFEEIHSMMRILEERRALAEVLEGEFGGAAKDGDRRVRVRIGEENALPELRNLSLVTKTYRMGERVVGVLGILGPKRMEYPRMMSLVEHISDMVSSRLETWDDDGNEGQPRPC